MQVSEVKMIKNEDFSKRFISLLLTQQAKLGAKHKSPKPTTGFQSVGQILASKDYQKHWERRLHENDKS